MLSRMLIAIVIIAAFILLPTAYGIGFSSASNGGSYSNNFGTFNGGIAGQIAVQPQGQVGKLLNYYVTPGAKIQNAINIAKPGETINIAAGTYNENIDIIKSLFLVGAGYTTTKLVAKTAGKPVIKVEPRVTAAISGMSISGGSASLGAGIYNGGALGLNSVLVDHNTAKSGGGIYNGGSMTITNSYIRNNVVTGLGFGGGIFNDGMLAMNGGSVDHNTAQDGGGIYNWGVMNLNKVPVTSNNAPGWGGGGIDNCGTIFITSSMIAGNTALGTYAAAGNAPGHEGDPIGLAGGLWNDDGRATIVNSIISGNKANVGGGIYTDGDTGHDSARLSMTGSSVDHNIAKMYAGGIYNWGPLTLSTTSVRYNVAATFGGGIFNDGSNGILTMYSGSVDHNAARSGGGIYNGGTLHITKSLVHDNTPNNIV